MKRFLSMVPALGAGLAAALMATGALASHPSVLPPPLAHPEILVEGHVFDHRTGQPMRNVEVVAVPWLSLVSFTPLDPQPGRAPDSPSTELTIFTPPGGPLFLPQGPSVYTDENGFYSFVVRADLFRSLSATCHVRPDSGRVLILPTSSALPIYDVREVRRNFYLKTGRKRVPRPKCQTVFRTHTTTVAD